MIPASGTTHVSSYQELRMRFALCFVVGWYSFTRDYYVYAPEVIINKIYTSTCEVELLHY